MANPKSTFFTEFPGSDPGRMPFCRHDAIILNPSADSAAVSEAINERLAQLEALTIVMADTDFDEWSNEITSKYAWMAARTVQEVRALSRRLDELHRAEISAARKPEDAK